MTIKKCSDSNSLLKWNVFTDVLGFDDDLQVDLAPWKNLGVLNFASEWFNCLGHGLMWLKILLLAEDLVLRCGS